MIQRELAKSKKNGSFLEVVHYISLKLIPPVSNSKLKKEEQTLVFFSEVCGMLISTFSHANATVGCQPF